MEIPYALKGDREIQAIRISDHVYELRHPWLPGAPRWAYPVLLLLAACGILFFAGWPGSRDALLFELGVLAIVAYPLAALCFNRTTLTVTPDTLRWRYGPLPWKPGGRVQRDQITAITHGRIRQTMSAEEFAEQRRSGYTPRPRYAVTLRVTRWPRERRVFDLVGTEAIAAGAARFLAEALGDLPVENCRQRNRAELPNWGWGLILVGVLAFIGLLLFAATYEGP